MLLWGKLCFEINGWHKRFVLLLKTQMVLQDKYMGPTIAWNTSSQAP